MIRVRIFTETIPAPSKRSEYDDNGVKCLPDIVACTLSGMRILTEKDLSELVKKAMLEDGTPAPILGKQILRDGKTGVTIRSTGDSRCDDHLKATSPGGR